MSSIEILDIFCGFSSDDSNFFCDELFDSASPYGVGMIEKKARKP
ncbi:hypothetical protein [Neobacillus sp. 19]